MTVQQVQGEQHDRVAGRKQQREAPQSDASAWSTLTRTPTTARIATFSMDRTVLSPSRKLFAGFNLEMPQSSVTRRQTLSNLPNLSLMQNCNLDVFCREQPVSWARPARPAVPRVGSSGRGCKRVGRSVRSPAFGRNFSQTRDDEEPRSTKNLKSPRETEGLLADRVFRLPVTFGNAIGLPVLRIIRLPTAMSFGVCERKAPLVASGLCQLRKLCGPVITELPSLTVEIVKAIWTEVDKQSIELGVLQVQSHVSR
jgi:hypothetical protein